jgi:hypothetical protein
MYIILKKILEIRFTENFIAEGTEKLDYFIHKIF